MENNRKNGNTGSGHEKLHNNSSADVPQNKNVRHFSAVKRAYSYGGRKVSKNNIKKEQNFKVRSEITEADKRRKIEKMRKNERLQRKRIQALLGFTLAIILAIVLIFMTPIFSITEIRLNGNHTVPKEIITSKVGDMIGANLFGTSSSKIERKMLEIPQISKVEVSKHIFPSYLELNITENRPAAYLLCGNITLIVNSDLKVIDDAGIFNKETLPSISGVSVSQYQLNSILDLKSDEKKAVLTELLKSLEDTGVIDKTSYISVDDLTSIKFNYDNRIEVLCGSQLQLERKVRMFTEALKTSDITENSMGTFDFSVPGQAVYIP